MERQIIVYGNGSLGKRFQKGIKKYSKKISVNILDDNDPSCLKLRDLKKFNKNVLIIFCIWNGEANYFSLKKKLEKIGFKNIQHYKEIVYRHSFFKRYSMFNYQSDLKKNKYDFRKLKKNYADKLSRKNFQNFLKFYNKNIFLKKKPKFQLQLKLKKLKNIVNKFENFVDCGAYTGDSYLFYKRYIKFKKYIGIEPNLANYKILKKNIKKNKKVEIFNNFVYSHMCKPKKFTNINSMSLLGFGKKKIIKPVVLDNIINSDERSIIKLDIEGYEKHALKGCKKLFLAKKSIFIISVYHSPKDFFYIADWINNSYQGYRFYLIIQNYDFVDSLLLVVPKSIDL